MLDNSIVYWTSEFSEPSQHVSSNSLCLLAGSAGGYFNTGRHINYNIHAQSNPDTLDYQSNESTHNLYTSFLQALGESDGFAPVVPSQTALTIRLRCRNCKRTGLASSWHLRQG